MVRSTTGNVLHVEHRLLCGASVLAQLWLASIHQSTLIGGSPIPTGDPSLQLGGSRHVDETLSTCRLHL
eukprot:1158801-Pelagomonas_calceolata.AAC.12